MTVKEIAIIILRKNYLFQVLILGTKFKTEKITIDSAISETGCVESYLTKIGNDNNAKQLLVKLFSTNGNSPERQGDELIILPEIEKPINIEKPIIEKPINIEKPISDLNTSMEGLKQPQEQAITPQKHTTMQDKDYIDYKVLEVKHDTLKHQHEESKSKIAKLEKKVEDLHEENKKALRDIATKDDKHELALDRVKLDNEKANSEQKESLSGVLVDTLKDPEIVKMFFQGFFPSKFPADQQAQLTGADDAVREIKYTTDVTANQVLNDIPRTLSQKNGDTIAKVYLLFQKMMSSTETFNEVMKQFVPELPTT